jgi:UDP-glucose 4-epimerase
MVGTRVMRRLLGVGHSARGFDLIDGEDVRDLDALAEAVRGGDAVIHLAAADVPLPADVMVETNVVGGANVIQVCVEAGVRRLVIASSVEALGIFMGEAPPQYLPIDDDHQASPTTPYGASKRAVERLAERVAHQGDLEVICLRPPGVFDENTVKHVLRLRAERASYEWEPLWEYSAWIHVDDLADALIAACFCSAPPANYACHLVAAADVNSDHYTGRELARRVHPSVPWLGGREYDEDARRSLLVTEPVQALLGWTPNISWLTAPSD